MKLIITGGAGFIGSALIRNLLKNDNYQVINIDKVTYAANKQSLKEFEKHDNYYFEQIDICDHDKVEKVFKEYRPDGLIHFAAESHVDRSIDNPADFLKTNILGTYNLLEISRKYLSNTSHKNNQKYRFHHISTDEVFGDLEQGIKSNEDSGYNPSSPYSATKASADHLVRAWYRTYNLPVVITNSSNNYGPYQYPEKFIPLTILNALEGKNIPIYGTGNQIRDWVYVDDNVKAIMDVFLNGKTGETYNICGGQETENIKIVRLICTILEELKPDLDIDFNSLITYVEDRLGHDKRYAIDSSKINHELNWKPSETLESGLRKTIEWYIDNYDNFNAIYDRKRIGMGCN